MINLDSGLLHALHDVAAHQVSYFPGYLGGHAEGFGWFGGGDLPQGEQDDLHILQVAHLIAPVPARVGCEIGCEVVLTPAGLLALSAHGGGA